MSDHPGRHVTIAPGPPGSMPPSSMPRGGPPTMPPGSLAAASLHHGGPPPGSMCGRGPGTRAPGSMGPASMHHGGAPPPGSMGPGGGVWYDAATQKLCAGKHAGTAAAGQRVARKHVPRRTRLHGAALQPNAAAAR
eukprot:CAMPEP_0203933974 /NCGR_PEP_ID=MMETSP0359-20131031/72049_1 /ASSEMBLY_ACC=CAM_ASM_000338 /TAXON_ID=268821 /ORGANISM="Scrippsiella Hangoei, Strain SHTV-5" /LENGTH=135 /DNA_ID=CAMNT_0050863631 /DNA_START=114 /DNA_END=516 /DNA_ORIENTATION=-